MQLGAEISYSLSFEYPLSMEVVFPDSTYDFSPFEYVRKEFLPTVADSTKAKDSVIYYLSSFEIDQVQKLALPVYILTDSDSTAITASPDSIYFSEMIPVMPDSVELRQDVNLLEVNKAINYPYILIGIGGLIVILVAGFIAFGDSIRKRFKLRRMRKKFEKFTSDFDMMFNEIRKGEKVKTEKLLVLWKQYMESLENRPYTKLTSKEIAKLSDAESFAIALKEIDRSIYGRMEADQIIKNFETLEDLTGERYQKKVWEVRHG